MMTWERKQAQIRELGFTVLGSGISCTVYGRGNIAIKIANRHSQLCDWFTYVEWCREHGFAGSFGPKVYSTKIYPWGFVAVMERLEWCLSDIAAIKGPDSREYIAYSKLDYLNTGTVSREARAQEVKEIDNAFPGFYCFFMQFIAAFPRVSDIYGKNVMWHAGRIVLIDPIINGLQDRTYNGWRANGPMLKKRKGSRVFIRSNGRRPYFQPCDNLSHWPV